MNVKVTNIKTDFVGTILPKDHSIRGAAFEDVLAQKGNPVSKGDRVDYPKYGLEVKTKDVKSTSANTVGSMTYENICSTPYNESPISEKIKQQLRVKVENGVVVNAKVYDFSPKFIQDAIKDAYEAGRARLIQDGNKSTYIPGTSFGYFERKKNKGEYTNSWAFRIRTTSMDKLENMSKSTYKNLFE